MRRRWISVGLLVCLVSPATAWAAPPAPPAPQSPDVAPPAQPPLPPLPPPMAAPPGALSPPPLAAPPGAPPPPPMGYGYMPPPAPAYIYAPPTLPYNEGDPIPLGYHKGTTPRASLAIAGAITFGIAWIPSLVVGTFGAPLLAIPVGGGFAMAGAAHGFNSGTLKAWLVIDGLQQTAGLIMLIAALAAPKTVLLRDDPRSAARWLIPRPLQLGTNAWGVGFGGQL